MNRLVALCDHENVFPVSTLALVLNSRGFVQSLRRLQTVNAANCDIGSKELFPLH